MMLLLSSSVQSAGFAVTGFSPLFAGLSPRVCTLTCEGPRPHVSGELSSSALDFAVGRLDLQEMLEALISKC